MVEVSEIGLEEKEEIELDLGLSIGGSFRKSDKPRPDSRSVGFESDRRDQNRQHQAVTEDRKPESIADVGMDPKVKREIHALRRQEAKKKRQQKRWVRESEPEDQRASKREKIDYRAAVAASTASFQATTQGQHPHPYLPVQYMPFNNGFVFPCAVPSWAPSASERNVGQSPATACRGFRPFSAYGCEPEQNGEREGVNGSSRGSPSLVSEHRSSSHEGGGSTDSHSHSAHSLAEPTQLNSSNRENNIRSQPEQSASSHPLRSEHGNAQGTNHTVKENQPKITQPEPTKLKEEATMNSKATPIEKPLSNENLSNGPLKEAKTDMGKPPKPLSQTSSLPQMPYVSTTGNGPNGKTVNGFLYRYTKSEVSIVCVCHGSTFSPAEFVQHAGGTDISHPLRHITVIPSAFG